MEAAESVDGLLTADRAAELPGVSRRTLWGITKSGELPANRIGRSIREARADIDAFIASHRTTGQGA